MQNFPQLETSRLTLREILPSDTPALLAMYQNREAMKWRGGDHLTTAEEVDRMIGAFAQARPVRGDTHWAMERKSEPGLIGKCGFYSIDGNAHHCLLAYEMCADHRGEGYMIEAVSALLHWAFTQTSINRIGAHVSPENTASRRLVSRLTFQQEGLLRQSARWADAYHDMLSFSVLRHEFLAASPAIRSMLADMGQARGRSSRALRAQCAAVTI